MKLATVAVLLLSIFLVSSAPKPLVGQYNNGYGLGAHYGIFGTGTSHGSGEGIAFGRNNNAFGGSNPYVLRSDGGLLYGLGEGGHYGGLFGNRGGIFGGNSGWLGGHAGGMYGPADNDYGFNGYSLTGIYGPAVAHGPGAALDHGTSAAGYTPSSSYGPGVTYLATAGYDNSNAYGYGLDGTPTNRGYGLPLLIDLGQSGLEYTGMLGYGDGYGGGYGGGTGGYGGYASGFGGYGGLLTSYQDVYKVRKPGIPSLNAYGVGSGAVDSGIEYTVPAKR